LSKKAGGFVFSITSGATTMHAIELPVSINHQHQIVLQLPQTIQPQKAKVIVMYENFETKNKPMKLGLFQGKIEMSDDFNEPLPDSFWLNGEL
jgi:hypothetical protein